MTIFAYTDKFSAPQKIKTLDPNLGLIQGKYLIHLPDFFTSNSYSQNVTTTTANKLSVYQSHFGYTGGIIEEFITSTNIDLVNSLDIQIGPNKTTYIGSPGIGPGFGYIETLDFVIPPSMNFYIHVDAFSLNYNIPNLVNVPTATDLQYSEITSGISVQLSYTGNAGFPSPVVPLNTNYIPGGAHALVRARIQFASASYISSLVILTNP